MWLEIFFLQLYKIQNCKFIGFISRKYRAIALNSCKIRIFVAVIRLQ